MKKSCYILIIAFVCATLSITCLATDKHFTDIPANAWYYSDVQNAVGNGLINGKTATTFAPEDNLTYAEAVKLAACMYKLSTEGNVDFVQSSPWYMPFVEYAKANNIISKDYDWEKKTTRAEYMDIFSKALPSEKLNEVNNVPDNSIPDVPMTHPYAPSIYKMYRSGIVQGSDAQFSCKPAENIKRSEVAAIIT
ncbi:MAG: S-layer homology domain-containing protein, partial [Clostridia bacterium]|nr:S-layer homology domain-containing protein [Clostridia bacterium]